MEKILKHLLVLFICTNIYAVDHELILSEEFPAKLSDFNFFKDASAQIPHDEVIPYELISSLFSDRFVSTIFKDFLITSMCP